MNPNQKNTVYGLKALRLIPLGGKLLLWKSLKPQPNFLIVSKTFDIKVEKGGNENCQKYYKLK